MQLTDVRFIREKTLVDAVNRRYALFQFVQDLVSAIPTGFADLIMEDGAYETAAVLIAALAEGPRVSRLSQLLLLSEEMVSEIASNMLAAGLWTATSVDCEHWFEEHNGLAGFCKDLLVAQGRLLRCPTGTGTYYYRQPGSQRWAA